MEVINKNVMRTFITGIFTQLKEILEKDPTLMLKRVEREIDLDFRKPLEDEDILKVLNHFKGSHVFPAWLLAVNNGLRHKDILRIKIENINFEKGYIILRETKTSHKDPIPKVVPITSYMSKVLKLHIENYGNKEYLIESKSHQQIKDLKWHRKTIKKELNLPCHFGLHQLRHTFATRLYKKEIEENAIKFLLSHADISNSNSVTRRYIHVELDDRIKKALEYKIYVEMIESRI